jgi:hypothetical protein
MAVPTYNSSLHHIGLKALGDGTMLGFMIENYRMELQREGVGAPEFGGQTDLIGQAPSVSRWTQDDFVGGMFAYTWGMDDAMFSDCTGFIPMPQARSVQSCPPMFFKKAIDPDTQSNYTTDLPKNMFMVGGSIYIVWDHTIARYQIDSDTLTWGAGSLDGDGTQTIVNAYYDSNDQVIWAFTNDTSTDVLPTLLRIKTDLTAATVPEFAGPAGTADQNATGFSIYHSDVVVAVGRKVYYGDMPDDPASGDPITWTKVGRLQGKWVDSIPYNGMLYILVNDGSFQSMIVAFDGTDLLEICTLPFNFYAKTITEYAGRVYVGGAGTDVNGGEHYAELYEITGSSTRLVRSFSPETRNAFLGGLAGEWPRSFDDMTVFEGMLWLCQKGKKMIAYDITSDGFFGAAEIQNETDLNMAKVVSGRGRIWGYFLDADEDANHGIYRIAQPADSVSSWNPTLVTSDFAFEPAQKKRWSAIRVMSRYGSCASIEYSINGGDTWTALTVTVVTSYGKVFYSDASLAAVSPSEHIRFRFKLTSTGEAGDARTYHRELVAHTLSFSMLDTGKYGWGFTIIGADEIETRDAELDEDNTQVYDVSDVRTTLRGWVENKTALVFKDLDKTERNVQIAGFVRLRTRLSTL